jgi:hypothetical protein
LERKLSNAWVGNAVLPTISGHPGSLVPKLLLGNADREAFASRIQEA